MADVDRVAGAFGFPNLSFKSLKKVLHSTFLAVDDAHSITLEPVSKIFGHVPADQLIDQKGHQSAGNCPVLEESRRSFVASQNDPANGFEL
jgi:hypothetical protein